MKTKVLSLIGMFVLGTFTVFAGEKTEKIEVNGNCGMCENRIEKAALSLSGVSEAEWDKESKNLEVTYDDEKTSSQKIQTSVAMAGHDTKLFSASDKTYSELPGCCKYQRDEKRTQMNHEKSSECSHEKTTECADGNKITSGSCCGGQ